MVQEKGHRKKAWLPPLRRSSSSPRVCFRAEGQSRAARLFPTETGGVQRRDTQEASSSSNYPDLLALRGHHQRQLYSFIFPLKGVTAICLQTSAS